MPFTQFHLHASLLHAIKDLAYTRPTPIQSDAIPPALEGRDLLACAATGSGKTVAFLLPTLHHLLSVPHPFRGHKPSARDSGGPRVLVLTPTRELAAQIHQNFLQLAAHTPITGFPVFGGASMNPQEHAFRTSADVIIATPGRLIDHLRHPYATLSKVEILILDEADRMLDMGFLPDIKRILQRLPEKKQTLFFSATIPGEIRHLSRELLRDPVTIQVERQSAPAAGITQAIYPVPHHLKPSLLVHLLNDDITGHALESVIVFTRTKHRADRLAKFLREHDISAVPIHGDRSQSQRTAALNAFKNGKVRLLVATDIAARGIDIPDVSHVINFDCPHIAEDYIHRVGRTGRAAATGDAFTFVSPEESENLRVIEKAIAKRLPRITLPDFDYAKPQTLRHKAQPASEESPRHDQGTPVSTESALQRPDSIHKPRAPKGPRGPKNFAPKNRRDQDRRKPSLPGHGQPGPYAAGPSNRPHAKKRRPR